MHTSEHKLSVDSFLPKTLRNALFKHNFIENFLPVALQTTGCAILLQKQPPVPSRHENEWKVYYHNCIRQGKSKSKTKRIDDGSFQQQNKHQTNEILKYKIKNKFTETILQ